MQKFKTTLPRYMALIAAAVIVLLPFHAFVTVWASTVFGHYTLLRLWKELLLAVLVAGSIWLLLTDSSARKWAGKEPILLLIYAYAACLIVSGAIALGLGDVTKKAFLYGLLLDGRFLAFFAVTWLITRYDDLLLRYWQRLLLVPGAIVIAFATLEYSVLPHDFLRHFGYGPTTIPPTATVDQQAAYQRVQASLRGPNPLGAYLVVVLSAVAARLLRFTRHRAWLIAVYVLGLGALAFTFSRSAWLGMLAAMLWLIWVSLRSARARGAVLIVIAAILVGFGVTALALRHNARFENVFFHTSQQSHSSQSSNAGHSAALKGGIHDIVHQPWGGGTGTAGPASAYNNHPARIAENYYVQLGQEGGLIVLGVFVAINVLVVLRLWRRRGHLLAISLLAGFIGVTVVNMLMHGWADDTLSYIWWGLAGVAIALPVGVDDPKTH